MDANKKYTPQTWPDHPETATMEGKNKFVGFWLLIAAESITFASLFATYLALKDKGPSGMDMLARDLYELPLVFAMTIILLTSSLTSVIAMHHMKNYNFKGMQAWLGITVLLGAAFLGLEIYEFNHYVHLGFGYTHSAFSSAFFTLVGVHGAHVLFGLGWFVSLMIRNAKRGLNTYNAPKFYLAALYWHFIDVVWVFIFTVVYLMGAMG